MLRNDFEIPIRGPAVTLRRFEDYFPSVPERHAKLVAAADQLRTLLKPKRMLHSGSIDLHVTSHDRMHADYEKSNIVAIRYDLDALPSDDQLARDYQRGRAIQRIGSKPAE